MPIAMMVDNPEGTQEVYDKFVRTSVWAKRLQVASFTWPVRARTAAGA